MVLETFIRSIVKDNPELKFKLKKAMSKQTPFQYVYQSLAMTVMSFVAIELILILVLKNNLSLLLMGTVVVTLFSYIFYKFWFSYVDVLIRKKARELDGELLFITEYFLVSLESGLPLGNAIQNMAKIKRPGGEFFKKVFTDFNTGKDLEDALSDAIAYSASEDLKTLLKRLKDSLNIGVDLKVILENFIQESSDKKIIEIKGYSKRLNPIVMLYLIVGIVLPSLGVTFFIIAATIFEITPQFLRLILILIFLIMFGMQYLSYSAFKFSKATL